jgi:hypothetical protein
LDPLADPGWDERIARCASASFFHTRAWARVLRDTYGFVPSYFLSGSDGRDLTVLPILEVDSWLTGRRGVSLPFTDECPAIARDADSFRQVFERALEFGRSRRWRYLEIRGGGEFLCGASPSTSYYGHGLGLLGGEKRVFFGLDSSVRSAIRKADQSGLTVEFSRDMDGMRAYYRLHCATRRRLGAPPQPYSFFIEIFRNVLEKGLGWLVVARHKGTPVAAAVFFCFERTVIFKFGASDEAFLQLRPNNRVMWEAIRRAIAEGFELLDFGRTSMGNEGLRRYKLGWGATERKITYGRYDLRSGGFVTAGDDSTGWQTAIFKILPASLSRLIGRVAYKHVA